MTDEELLAMIIGEFEKSEVEAFDTLRRVERRQVAAPFGDESPLIAHQKMLVKHYGSRGRALRALSARLAEL